jgi:hypothetical protein
MKPIHTVLIAILTAFAGAAAGCIVGHGAAPERGSLARYHLHETASDDELRFHLPTRILDNAHVITPVISEHPGHSCA